MLVPFFTASDMWSVIEGLDHVTAIEILKDRKRGRDIRDLPGLKVHQPPKTYTVLRPFLEGLGDERLIKVTRGFFFLLSEVGVFEPKTHIAGDGPQGRGSATLCVEIDVRSLVFP